jgi:hypothetical protein
MLHFCSSYRFLSALASFILSSFFTAFHAILELGIETEWSRGMMESIGFRFVEGFDVGQPKGDWSEVSVHWARLEQNLRGAMR